ncbi:AAA family ATPase [Mesorhizobium caraganae]|uniref:AAA family ATPase n=1 Tax=Mesorhizobium caraganae TaxID=483206 RepID=UPI003ECFEA71
MTTVFDLLFGARNTLGSGGNRRRLFNRFDEVLSADLASLPDSAFVPELALKSGTGPFQFTRIALRNWKAFEFAEMVFPRSEPDRPVILVGGNNGNGKTSILEAITSGLYGIRGLVDLERRARNDGNESTVGTRRSEYRQFIERAMHRPAFEQGDRMMQVVLEFDTAEGLLELDRRWYFDEKGKFSEEDEELVLRRGPDRDIVAAASDDVGRRHYLEEIERLLAPASMVPFFLFDGEHIRRLAERELGEQVRYGIESALGVTALRGLAEDLNDYAKDRGRDLQADDAEASLAKQVELHEVESAAAQAELERIAGELGPLRRRRDEIVRGIGSLGEGTYEARHEDIELKRKAEAELHALRQELSTASARLLPFTLIGDALLDATASALRAIPQTADPTGAEGSAMLGRLLGAIAETQPPLTPDAQADIIRRAEQAWKRVVGDPTGSTETINDIHAYLRGHRVDRVCEVLRASRVEAKPALISLIERIKLVKNTIERQENRESELRSVGKTRMSLSVELEDINARIAALEAERRAVDLQLARSEAKLEPIRAEWQRRRAQRRGSVTALAAVEAASKAASAINAAIEQVVPLHYARLANRVSQIYRKLAHKGIVDDVTIEADGAVALLDAKGRNLRETDPSAGESQIFAMALIAAVSDLAGSPLPLVIDTPLGRLDPEHRDRILDHFAGRSVQTILLSQPEEVGGRYYDRISSKVSTEYRLSYSSQDGGLGATVLERGYFPRQAA